MKKARALALPLTHEYRFERALFRTAVALLLALVCGYVYFVADSAISVIAKNEAEREAVRLESVVGELESRLFAMSETISPELAPHLGLVPVENKHFVRRLEAVGRATTASDAI